MPVLPEYSDEQILDAARQRRDGPVQSFYNSGFKMAYDLIKERGISRKEDIEEVYQASFSIFLGYVLDENFKLTSKLSTFLVGICKRQALKHKKLGSRLAITSHVEEEFENIADDEGETRALESMWLIYTEEFDKMSLTKKECHELLRLFMIEGKDYVAISQLLGRENTKSLKTQKGRCLSYLRREIFQRVNYE